MVARRWEKIKKKTRCSEAEARVAAVLLVLMSTFKEQAKLMSEPVRDYMMGKASDMIIEIMDGSEETWKSEKSA